MGICHRGNRLLLGICLTSTIIGIIFMVKLENNVGSEYSGQKLIPPTKFMVNTNACKIPRTPIWPECVKKKWKVRNKIDCSPNQVLVRLNDSDQMLRIFPEFSDSSCCLSEVFRVDKNDSNFRCSNCTKILGNFVDVSEMEILAIKCGVHVNYEANIPIKSTVRRKMNKWEHRKSEDLPLNVLVIGIDTVSRSHAFRSIPRTMDLLKQMGFKDFRGYHSVATSTLSNFMAFLMGLDGKVVRGGCAPNWKSPFDSCPLIWKDFSLHDYVTMFTEDGKGTFNWGGQSGFHSAPTDYYIRPLFLATDYKSCISWETVPQFVLRYTLRFVQKFNSTPFFSFTWLNSPSHDSPYTLSNLEIDSFQFFDSLRSIPGLLERTFVIFMRDHGDRTSFSDSGAIEAYIERGLPPLFIRFPELLKKRHPELEFEQNVNFFTSPFDLHQTFLHILALDGSKVPATPVVRENDQRQSLSTWIDSTNRSCATLNISEAVCVCNIDVDAPINQLVSNKHFRSKIVNILTRELNQVVASSKYGYVCAQWTILFEWVSTVRILQKTPLHSDLHVQFSADGVGVRFNRTRGIASFEAKIRVTHKPNRTEESSYTLDDCKLIGGMTRVNLYGNQSSCVEFVTDSDKEIKGFCLCKSTAVPKWKYWLNSF